VDNLAAVLMALLAGFEPHVRPVVVDFCGGSGHTALPLAHRFPHCDFVIVDSKVPARCTRTRPAVGGSP
jgi:methylase of polypeptide subunit release factors